MFQSTRLALTAYYLFIIMLISGVFSVIIYNSLAYELNRISRAQEIRMQLPRSRLIPAIDIEVIEETKNRAKITLGIINIAIAAIAGTGGYFLAGKTLKPIQAMVNEQNRFIADASHELRTPLSSLKSEIEVTLLDKKLSLHEAKKMLQSNLEEVNRLQKLSDDLLSLSQYRKRMSRFTPIPVLVSELVSDAQVKVQGLLKEKQITLEKKIPQLHVLVEQQSMTELLIILFDNAIKYSPPKTKIIITTKLHKHTAVISVADQGQGIAADVLPHIFDRFYRADNARSTTGHGLGLAIASEIARKHSTEITVQNGKNGALFSIALPTAS